MMKAAAAVLGEEKVVSFWRCVVSIRSLKGVCFWICAGRTWFMCYYDSCLREDVPHRLGWLKSTSGAAVWIGAIVACGLCRGRGRLWDVWRVKMGQRHSADVEEDGAWYFLREAVLGEEERIGRKK